MKVIQNVWFVLIELILINFASCSSIQSNINDKSLNVNKAKIPKHILNLKSEEQRKFLDSFDLFATDLDGVLWTMQTQISGSGDAIKLIRKAGKRCTFITNNSFRSKDENKQYFHDAGIEIDMIDLLHPAQNVVEYLKRTHFNGLIYCIAVETFKDHLRNAGFKIIDGPNKFISENLTIFANHIFDNEPVKAVIVDVDFNVSGPKLIRAQMYLMKIPESILILGATDCLMPFRPGVNIIGPGPFGKIIAEASGKKPIILGKPGSELCKVVMDRYDIHDPKRVIMVGDMLEQDIGFGKACGFQTMSVLTGGSKKVDFNNPIYSNVLPDYYADSLADFVEFFKKLETKT